jgi:hypothetical protein
MPNVRDYLAREWRKTCESPFGSHLYKNVILPGRRSLLTFRPSNAPRSVHNPERLGTFEVPGLFVSTLGRMRSGERASVRLHNSARMAVRKGTGHDAFETPCPF